MKISTRGRYGIRLLIDLAEHTDEPHVPLMVIAERQSISARYLEQVAVILRRTGFIRSVKGAAGGYALAKSPHEITVGEVLRALEGDLLVVDNLLPGEKQTHYQSCIRSVVYERLNSRIATLLDNKTLSSITGTSDPDASYMYFILMS